MMILFYTAYFFSIALMLISSALKFRAAWRIRPYRNEPGGSYPFWLHITHGAFWGATGIVMLLYPPVSVSIDVLTALLTFKVNTWALVALFVTFCVDRVPAWREALYMSGDLREGG